MTGCPSGPTRLIQVLNVDLLPVHLDVLQVRKAKVCSVSWQHSY